MRDFNSVKLENMRFRDGTFDVDTKIGRTYEYDIENHYRIDADRLVDVMSHIDEWISSVYNIANNKNIRRPFRATIDTGSETVHSISVKIEGQASFSETLSKEIDTEFSTSGQVQKKQL